MDRKTLRQKMKEGLSEEQNKNLEKKVKPGRKREEKNPIRSPRGKKQNIDLSEEIKELSSYGVTPTQIEMIFEKMQLNKSTKIAKDTFIYKLIDILRLFEQRNVGIKKESRGFISTNDITMMILKNPKIMTIDTNRSLSKFLGMLDKNATSSIEVTNQLVKENPSILNIGKNKIEQECNILNKFNITKGRYSNNLLQHCISEGGKIFQVNSQKLFHRLCYFTSVNRTNNINNIQYSSLGRKDFKQGLNNTTDKDLEYKYVLPKKDDEFEQKVQNIINSAIKESQMQQD